MLLLQGRDQCSEESFSGWPQWAGLGAVFQLLYLFTQECRLSSVKEAAANKQTVIDEEEDY